MKFEDALKAMREGKKVRRAGLNDWISIRDEEFVYSDPHASADASWSDDAILATDWEIVRETFDFLEACRRMKAGKRVRREGWAENSYAYACHYEMLRIGHTPDGSRSNAPLAMGNALATDWFEVEP